MKLFDLIPYEPIFDGIPGLPAWALLAAVGAVAVIVFLIVFFIVRANRKK